MEILSTTFNLGNKNQLGYAYWLSTCTFASQLSVTFRMPWRLLLILDSPSYVARFVTRIIARVMVQTVVEYCTTFSNRNFGKNWTNVIDSNNLLTCNSSEPIDHDVCQDSVICTKTLRTLGKAYFFWKRTTVCLLKRNFSKNRIYHSLTTFFAPWRYLNKTTIFNSDSKRSLKLILVLSAANASLHEHLLNNLIKYNRHYTKQRTSKKQFSYLN